ncbi:M48 family metallopeptidase [uncultured Veillonella sp.]|uniref:M48 family metallopeptidase n=1 Tax=uncultured Veillonella sp. TaxID=159268 RepID=UPI0025FA1767|nr:SprT family zinc-dependent metalloprotease [uncultured Veillonella sp.]MDY3973961.1 SprT family zinc-dependent metalloprotease [Veillonella caviae]
MSGLRQDLQARSTSKKIEHYEVIIDGRPVPYTVTWKAVKNLNLRVNSEGTVSVSVPFRTSVSTVREFVEGHKDFLRKARARAVPKVRRSLQYVNGEKVRILGHVATLVVRYSPPGRKAYVSWSESRPDTLYMFIKDHMGVPEKAALMTEFLQGLMEEVVLRVGGAVYEAFIRAGYDIQRPTFRVAKAKTRWGSCSPALGRIMINQQLLSGPIRFLQYVMVHEFAHLIHPNHSPSFWAVVAQFMPRWKEIRKELNTYFRGR